VLASLQEDPGFLRMELFRLGGVPVTPASLAQGLALLVLVWIASGLTRRLLRDRVLKSTALDVGAREAIARISGYVVLVLGVGVVLSTAGLDLSSLAVLGGALGIGIGFGLQNIVNNFVSGLIILFERPITIGQRVEVGGTTGVVQRIGARSTTIVTNDRITHIIPNSEFVSKPVINWSHGGDLMMRIAVTVRVAHGSDPRAVERLLLEVAAANRDVSRDPPPDVLLDGFGNESIDFRLRVFSETLSGTPAVLRSQLNFAIWDALERAGIRAAFHSRDMSIRGPVRVELGRADGPAPGDAAPADERPADEAARPPDDRPRVSPR
jgi:small-conductance mechanosensitive channel